MIRSLFLKNFKSYREVKFVFDKRITLIKGEGLSGKSNIRRAIELINDYRFNKNNKAKFSGNQEMVIEVETDSNKLKLTYDEDIIFEVDSQKFKRKKTPEELKRAFAIDEINIQGQLEHPFIVENNSSQLSKTINRITGIEKIDLFIKEINSKLKINKFFLKKEKQDLLDLEQSKEKLKFLPRIKENLKQAKQFRKQIDQKQNIISEVKNILYKIEKIELKIGRFAVNAKAEIEIKVSEKISGIIKEKQDRINAIKICISDIEECGLQIKNLRRQYRKLLIQYMDKLREEKVCPYCLQDINKDRVDNIKRTLKNEINSVK